MMVELSDKEARIFRALAESHALDIKSGSVTIHFDYMGMPVKTEVRTVMSLSTDRSIDIKVVV